MRRCLSCDTENSPTAKFCIECAKPLGVQRANPSAYPMQARRYK
jgi:hypothetical protein